MRQKARGRARPRYARRTKVALPACPRRSHRCGYPMNTSCRQRAKSAPTAMVESGSSDEKAAPSWRKAKHASGTPCLRKNSDMPNCLVTRINHDGWIFGARCLLCDNTANKFWRGTIDRFARTGAGASAYSLRHRLCLHMHLGRRLALFGGVQRPSGALHRRSIHASGACGVPEQHLSFQAIPLYFGTNPVRHAGGSTRLRRHVHVHTSSARQHCRPPYQRAGSVGLFRHHPHHGMVRHVCTTEPSRHYRAGRMRGKHRGIRVLGHSFVPSRSGKPHHLGPAPSLGRPSSEKNPKATVFSRACLDAPCAKCFPPPYR